MTITRLSSPPYEARTRAPTDLSIAGRTIGDLASNDVQPPLVSFVVICWNYARYVAQAIRSIREQDYPHFECLVIDNGSTDDSASVIRTAIDGDARFRMERLDRNMGQLGAAIWSLGQIRGGFVVFVDADDLLFSNFASTHLQVHLALPKSTAFTSNSVAEVDADGKFLTSGYSHVKLDRQNVVRGLRPVRQAVRLPMIADDRYEVLAACTATMPRELLSWLWGPGTANMYRKSMLDLIKLGDGNQSYMRSADGHFNPLCHALAGSAVIDLPVSAYRMHGSNYFARLETLEALRKGTKAYDEKSRLEGLQSAELLLEDVAKFEWLLGRRYWRILDQCAGAKSAASRRLYRRREAREMFARHVDKLVHAFGEARVARELAKRFGYRAGRKMLAQSLKRRVSLRLRGHLLLQSLLWPLNRLGGLLRSRSVRR